LLKSGRNVFVPKVIGKADLQSHRIYSLSDLSEGEYGIEEPQTPVSKRNDFDCIIIPMLGADKNGNRIGYGKGFYDVFLSQNSGVKIGLVYDDCLTEALEHDTFDIPMDIIITE